MAVTLTEAAARHVNRYLTKYRLVRKIGTLEQDDPDARYTVEIWAYTREAEVVDQANEAALGMSNPA